MSEDSSLWPSVGSLCLCGERSLKQFHHSDTENHRVCTEKYLSDSLLGSRIGFAIACRSLPNLETKAVTHRDDLSSFALEALRVRVTKVHPAQIRSSIQ